MTDFYGIQDTLKSYSGNQDVVWLLVFNVFFPCFLSMFLGWL